MFERERLLLGSKVDLINAKTVLVLGLGGVGGYTLESLVRAGIGKVIIVDNDTIDVTNLNRQIISLTNNIGNKKVDEWEKRIKAINPELEVIKYDMFVDEKNIDILLENKIDYFIDACDSINTKKEIIRRCIKNKIKFIMSMGTGNKLDASKLMITDLRKTSYDPLAKILRKMVKDERINGKIPVVSSSEEPLLKGKVGTISYLPAVAGLLITNYVIKDILRSEEDV